MTGGDQRHERISRLLSGYFVAVLFLSRKQDREDIPDIVSIGKPPLDKTVNERIAFARGGHAFAERGEGKIEWQVQKSLNHADRIGDHAVDSLSDVRLLFENIDIDQYLDDHAQDEGLHLAREIDFHSRLPSVHCLSRVLNNHAGIVLDTPPGKSRLEEATLSIMILPIGRQQKISHQFAQTFSHFVREIARIFRQNIADMLRSEQEDDRCSSNINCCHPTISPLNIQ